MSAIRPAECHPDRRHQAKGLCASCYQAAWQLANPERYRARTRRRAECHPERPVLAQNLCGTCYRRMCRADPEKAERERAYAREWSRKKRAGMTPRERHKLGLRRYGLTPEDFAELVIAQWGCCAACNEPTPELEVDHCHARGRQHVRGLLCHNCNSALGHAKDDLDRLRALIAYLARTA